MGLGLGLGFGLVLEQGLSLGKVPELLLVFALGLQLELCVGLDEMV